MSRKGLLGLLLLLALVGCGVLLKKVTQPILLGNSAPSTAPESAQLVSPERLRQHVKKLSTEFIPRDHRHIDNLDAVAAYIQDALQQAGAKVHRQPYKVDGSTYQNVIAVFGPESPERIVIGAHYDAWGPHPGADDNASGVAGLLELARRLQGAKLKHRVELVAYTLEEPPYFRTAHMGSAVHARALKAGQARVKLMLSLECIGYFSDQPDTQDYPLPGLGLLYPTTGNFIAIAGRFEDGALAKQVKQAMQSATPLPVYSINAPGFVTGIDFSDQLNYWAEDFPGLMVTDTAFYRNQGYHTANDTFEHLDYSRMAQVVEGVFAAVVSIE